jgi:REP element-mobilizing transposase RayT
LKGDGVELRRPEIANVAVVALHHFDDERYRLFARCVMPNHVHVVLRVLPGNKLADVVHPWKPFTAKQANELIERRAIFWQREY